MLASARPRYAAVLEGLRGISPRSQGTLGQEGLSSAIALGGLGCRRSYARRGLIPLRCGTGSVPPIYTKGDTPYYTAAVAMAPQNRACTRREHGDRGSFRAGARGGIGCSRSDARFGPVPLPLGVPLRCARTLRGRSHLFTQKGTLLTIQLPLRWLRRTGPALAGNMGTGGAFALAREGE